MKDFQINEEIVYKKGIRRCSGRIRDGKFLYYLPKGLKKEVMERITADLRKNLLARLKEAYPYQQFFKKYMTKLNQAAQLKTMAESIYIRKYPHVDFPLAISFRRQKTVLGTYRRNADGEVTIYINDLLKKAPEMLIEYVVAHELSHHHCPGHDKAFYRELSALCPNHEEKRKLATQFVVLREAGII